MPLHAISAKTYREWKTVYLNSTVHLVMGTCLRMMARKENLIKNKNVSLKYVERQDMVC